MTLTCITGRCRLTTIEIIPLYATKLFHPALVKQDEVESSVVQRLPSSIQ